MRTFTTIFSLILFCMQLSAQEKIDAFQLISDVCENTMSVNDFKYKYADYLTKNQDKNDTDLGIFCLNNISFAGYESEGKVTISPDENKIGVGISLNYNVLDNISRYQIADKCHKCLTAKLGQPIIEINISSDIPSDIPEMEQIREALKELLGTKEGVLYMWLNKNTAYVSVRYKDNEGDLYTLAAVSVSSTIGQAQEHLTFKGVPIDGTLDTYVANMKKAGFTFIGEDDGMAILRGDFAGYRNCTIGVATLKSIDIVNRISILFDSHQNWNNIYVNYSSLKEMLTTKYGKYADCVEKFEGYSEPRDDHDKMFELTMDRCKFFTIWKTDKGSIELEIIKGILSGGMVRLTYWDKINTMLVQVKAMNDL